jgi:hypothetical protein
MRNDVTAQKHPAFGGANRLPGCVAAVVRMHALHDARCAASRFKPRLPWEPISTHQIDPIWPECALGVLGARLGDSGEGHALFG